MDEKKLLTANSRKSFKVGGLQVKRDSNSKSNFDIERGSFNINTLRRRSTTNSMNLDHLLVDDNLFKFTLIIMNKPSRNFGENQILIAFLRSLTKFSNFIKNLSNSTNNEASEDLIKNISFALKLEIANSKDLIYRNGDKIDKFYILFRGKVAVLVPRSFKKKMTETEYIKYLLKLRNQEEYELLGKCLHLNYNQFGIDAEEFEKLILQDSPERLKKTNSAVNIKNNNINKINNDAANNRRHFSKKSSTIKQVIERNSKFISPRKESSPHKEVKACYTIDEYIKLTSPNNLNNNSNVENHNSSVSFCNNDMNENNKISLSHEERKDLTVFEYYHIQNLSPGEKFGDFDNVTLKRQETILATEDSFFGFMEKASYDECLCELNERIKRTYLNVILNQPLFLNINKGYFSKTYFNLFIHKRLERKDKLLLEDKEAENVYIVLDGEFEVTFKKSQKKINEIIKNLGGYPDNYNYEQEHFEGKFLLILILITYIYIFRKFKIL